VRLDVDAYSSLAISPDGARVAFLGCGDVDECQLYLRERSEIDARPLPGTENAVGPFFSPDGRWIGFHAQGKLKKIDLELDTVVTVADAPNLRGAAWADDGTIVFSTVGGGSGLLRVSAEGGEVEPITKLDAGEESHRWPQILPGGHAALFEILGSRDVAVIDLETGTKRTLIEGADCPKYAPSGHLLFGRDGVVYATPFDLKGLSVRGPPAPVLEGVAMWSTPSISRVRGGVVAYDISRDGTLLYSPRESRLPKRTLVALDRKGARETLSPLQRAYCNPRFSPDGGRVAVTVQTDVSARDALVLDIRSGAWTRVNVGDDTSTPAGAERTHLVAAWMPDGERLVLAGDREGLLVRIDCSEAPKMIPFLVDSLSTTVASDGRALLTAKNTNRWDIWRVGLTGEGAAEPWLATPSEEAHPRFSPDGRWVAYYSDDSGSFEVYVRPYTGAAVRHQISTQGGTVPQWSRDGKEIFFKNRASLWCARVRTSPSFAADPPRKLFDLPEDIESDFYDVSPDSKRFVMVERDPLELPPSTS
jgi:serine/threonine-protein kinase